MGLVPEITDVFDSFMEESSNTITSLSNRCHLSYSTVRRVMKDEYKPNLDKLRTILSLLVDRITLKNLLELQFPDKQDYIDLSFKVESAVIDGNLDPYMGDEIGCQIIGITGTTVGSHVTTIEEIHGKNGLLKLDELVESNVIVEEKDGSLRLTNPNYQLSCLKYMAKKVEIHARTFNTSNVKRGCAGIVSNSESVTKEGISKIRNLSMTYASDLQTIYREFSGNIPSYAQLIFNVYDNKEFL